MKKLLLLLLSVVAFPAYAEVSIMTVTDEDKHTHKEDFYHFRLRQ